MANIIFDQVEPEDKAGLSLLLMESDDDKDHFDYKEIVKKEAKKSKKRKNKKGQKDKDSEDPFQVSILLISDSVETFLDNFSSQNPILLLRFTTYNATNSLARV
jgi:hypothetical protein